MKEKRRVEEALEYLQGEAKKSPRIGLILGSGLGILADEMEDTTRIPYQQIPNFPLSTAIGHKGELVFGRLAAEGEELVAMQGRFHCYEGYDLMQVTLPVRVMALMGVKHLVITNAAGGINRSFQVGDLMLIRDHINLMGDNPLRGPNIREWGPRFPDMTTAYPEELISRAEDCARQQGLITRRGVYAAVMGPNYETPAEIRYLRRIGADAVGMSTVPEVLVANHMGLKVIGISCITNMAAGVLAQPLDHREVLETAERVKPQFVELVRSLVATLTAGGDGN